MLDLTKDYDSYLFGIILADGGLYFSTRNRGKVQIELSYEDKDIIEAIYAEFSKKSSISARVRTTQYKQNYKTIIWTCYLKEFRDSLMKLGMPKEDKSKKGRTPICEYNVGAFWRGFIDGDGSIGMTGNDEPFISVVIKSADLASDYLQFLKEQFNIIKILNPNKRDSVYNIMVKNEDALSLGDYIYNNSTIQLERKYKKYQEIKTWKRTVPKVNSRTWIEKEDNFILNNDLQTSMERLKRTEASIKMRLWRLKKHHTDSNK